MEHKEVLDRLDDLGNRYGDVITVLTEGCTPTDVSQAYGAFRYDSVLYTREVLKFALKEIDGIIADYDELEKADVAE